MVKEQHETALEMADRHVRLSLRHVARQKELIEKLRSHDLATDSTEQLLATFVSIQKAHEAYLLRLLAKVDRDQSKDRFRRA